MDIQIDIEIKIETEIRIDLQVLQIADLDQCNLKDSQNDIQIVIRIKN